jgi:hypothetical protein
MGVYSWLSKILGTRYLNKNFLRFRVRSNGDITYKRTFWFEVKGVRNRQWEEYGRMVTPNQAKAYAGRNSIIVWATTTEEEDDDTVIIHGWNLATEFVDATKSIEKRTICDNIALRNLALMRPLSLLESALRLDKRIIEPRPADVIPSVNPWATVVAVAEKD